ncbi:MAG: hypothetical protein ABIH19_04300, partial [Candidatus Omnitrophota bacterium]
MIQSGKGALPLEVRKESLWSAYCFKKAYLYWPKATEEIKRFMRFLTKGNHIEIRDIAHQIIIEIHEEFMTMLLDEEQFSEEQRQIVHQMEGLRREYLEDADLTSVADSREVLAVSERHAQLFSLGVLGSLSQSGLSVGFRRNAIEYLQNRPNGLVVQAFIDNLGVPGITTYVRSGLAHIAHKHKEWAGLTAAMLNRRLAVAGEETVRIYGQALAALATARAARYLFEQLSASADESSRSHTLVGCLTEYKSRAVPKMAEALYRNTNNSSSLRAAALTIAAATLEEKEATARLLEILRSPPNDNLIVEAAVRGLRFSLAQGLREDEIISVYIDVYQKFPKLRAVVLESFNFKRNIDSQSEQFLSQVAKSRPIRLAKKAAQTLESIRQRSGNAEGLDNGNTSVVNALARFRVSPLKQIGNTESRPVLRDEGLGNGASKDNYQAWLSQQRTRTGGKVLSITLGLIILGFGLLIGKPDITRLGLAIFVGVLLWRFFGRVGKTGVLLLSVGITLSWNSWVVVGLVIVVSNLVLKLISPLWGYQDLFHIVSLMADASLFASKVTISLRRFLNLFPSLRRGSRGFRKTKVRRVTLEDGKLRIETDEHEEPLDNGNTSVVNALARFRVGALGQAEGLDNGKKAKGVAWKTGLLDLEGCKAAWIKFMDNRESVNQWRMRASLAALAHDKKAAFIEWAGSITDDIVKNVGEFAIHQMNWGEALQYKPACELWETLRPFEKNVGRSHGKQETDLFYLTTAFAEEHTLLAHGTANFQSNRRFGDSSYADSPLCDHWALLNIMIEGKFTLGEPGPLDRDITSPYKAGRYGPYFIIFDRFYEKGESMHLGSSDSHHAIYLVPRQESVVFLAKGLDEAVRLGFCEQEHVDKVLSKIMTYQQFVDNHTQIKDIVQGNISPAEVIAGASVQCLDNGASKVSVENRLSQQRARTGGKVLSITLGLIILVFGLLIGKPDITRLGLGIFAGVLLWKCFSGIGKAGVLLLSLGIAFDWRSWAIAGLIIIIGRIVFKVIFPLFEFVSLYLLARRGNGGIRRTKVRKITFEDGKVRIETEEHEEPLDNGNIACQTLNPKPKTPYPMPKAEGLDNGAIGQRARDKELIRWLMEANDDDPELSLSVSSWAAGERDRYWRKINRTLESSAYYKRLKGTGTIIPLFPNDQEVFTGLMRLSRIEAVALALIESWRKHWAQGRDTARVNFDPDLIRFFSIARVIGMTPFSISGRRAIRTSFNGNGYDEVSITQEIIAQVLPGFLDKNSTTPLRLYLQEIEPLIRGEIDKLMPEARAVAVAYRIVKVIEQAAFARTAGLIRKDRGYSDLNDAIKDLLGASSVQYIDVFPG